MVLPYCQTLDVWPALTCARAKDVRLACQMHLQYFRARRCEHPDARLLLHQDHRDHRDHRDHLFHRERRAHRGHPGALGD
jgi:hypothetical protein